VWERGTNPFENRTLSLVGGILLLAFAAFELLSGKAIVAGRPRRTYSTDRPARTVTRADDPVLFYMEVLVAAGLGGFLLYR
jgi:hypothetical protein